MEKEKEDYCENGIYYAGLGEFIECRGFKPTELDPKDCKFWDRAECQQNQREEKKWKNKTFAKWRSSAKKLFLFARQELRKIPAGFMRQENLAVTFGQRMAVSLQKHGRTKQAIIVLSKTTVLQNYVFVYSETSIRNIIFAVFLRNQKNGTDAPIGLAMNA